MYSVVCRQFIFYEPPFVADSTEYVADYVLLQRREWDEVTSFSIMYPHHTLR